MSRSHAQRRPDPSLSDISVTEFLALARIGFLPHGIVVGCAFWDAGAPTMFSSYGSLGNNAASAQIDAITIAASLRAARQQALARMWEQARDLGAEGVVGVKLELEHHRWHGGHQVAKILAVGTAIAFDPDHGPRELADSPPLTVLDGGPFTSDLSAHDFVALLRSGYRPVALATGNSLYAVDGSIARAFRTSWQNLEIAAYTQAFFDAREEAMGNLQRDLFAMFPQNHPDMPVGIVGMSIAETAHAGFVGFVEFTAHGTAIAPLRPDDPRNAHAGASPTIVVPLDG